MTKGNYSYPLDPSWSTEEITTVLHFLSQVEKAYESKVDRDQLLEAYKAVSYTHLTLPTTPYV